MEEKSEYSYPDHNLDYRDIIYFSVEGSQREVVEMDITAISTIVATVSIVIGVIFTILELRHLRRSRETEIIMKIYDRFSSKEIVEAMNKVGASNFVNIVDFTKKYSLTEITQLAVLFEEIGILLEQNLINMNLVDCLFGPTLNSLWVKMKPVIYAMRQSTNQPFFTNFEHLVNRLESYRKNISSTPC
jgi:hypothetical protein